VETVNKKKTFIRAARRNVDKHLQLEKYDVLSGGQNRYLVQKIVGKGAFGQVAQCLRLDTKEKMAVKIVRKDESWAGKRELVMLQRLKNVDHDKYNLIKLIEHFEHNGHICLVFEMLHISVESFIERISLKPLRLPSIRMIAQQLLMALYALKKTGVVHADIKPDNIMLVDQNLHSFKVKLIDFGMALPLSRMHTGTIIQIIGYRAPEVILGLPLGVAVDMWSLGCVLAFLYVGWDPIPLHCQYEALKVIIRVLGQPGNHLLDARECPLRCCSNKSPRAEVYMGSFHTLKRLEELQKFHPCDVDSTYEYEDTKNFLSLLKQMLHVDPKQRITPKEALKHKFINPPLLNDTNTEPSTFTAPSTMKKCHLTASPDKSQRLKTFTKATSTSDICQNADGEGDNKDKGVETEGFVEVKTKQDSGLLLTPYTVRLEPASLHLSRSVLLPHRKNVSLFRCTFSCACVASSQSPKTCMSVIGDSKMPIDLSVNVCLSMYVSICQPCDSPIRGSLLFSSTV
uniref:Protein kinase domain-containing protein n=1 Tax=Echeneis naucrates TaxID=173247 RepID=A0A665WTX1_ECHNA